MNENFTIINRIVKSDPSLQRLRDVATSLYLNELQVSNLVNEVVRFYRTSFIVQRATRAYEGNIDYNYILSVGVVNMVFNYSATRPKSLKDDVFGVFRIFDDLAKDEYVFVFPGKALLGYCLTQVTSPNQISLEKCRPASVFGEVDYGGIRFISQPVGENFPLVSSGSFMVVPDIPLSCPDQHYIVASFNLTGVRVKFRR